MRGKFIVFEGVDGCGKGTQLKLAASYVFDKNKDYNVFITREPTKDFKEIRERLAKGTNVKKDAEWYTEMFIEDRKQHLKNYIIPLLEKGVHIICDRYKYSTLVYQNMQGIDFKKLMDMHKAFLIPDLILIFDCSPKIAFERRKTEGATEVFDKDLEFQEKLRENYLKLKDLLPSENIKVIDATPSINDVFKEVKIHIDKIL